MKKNNLYSLMLMIWLMTLFLFSACDEEKDVTYKIKVESYGSAIEGYYFYDDSSTVTFSKPTIDGVGSYESTFKNPDYEIHVYAITTTPSSATSLKIFLFKNGASATTPITGTRINGDSTNIQAILDFKLIKEEEETTTGTPKTSDTTY